jgi:hypothetical protein
MKSTHEQKSEHAQHDKRQYPSASVLILRVFCVRRVYRGSIFFSLVLILHIPVYLGIKGDQFFTDRIFFRRSFYVQIGVLQFVLHVRFFAKLNVSNLYVMNLY